MTISPVSSEKPLHLPGETIERIGPFWFIQKKGVSGAHRLTSDSLHLANFVIPALEGSSSVIDLGTGSGVIPLIIASRSSVERIVGVETDRDAAKLARRNIEINSLKERISIIEGDYRDLPGVFEEGSFDCVVSNPPYVKAGCGRLSPYPSRAMARAEVRGGLTDLIRVSRHLAGGGGRISYIFLLSRRDEMIEEAEMAGLILKRLEPVRNNGKEGVFLIEFSGA